MWVNAIKDIETGKIRLMTEADLETTLNLDKVERHTVPCRKKGDQFVFGIHDFTRECICRPRIERDHYGYEIVIHEDRKPN